MNELVLTESKTMRAEYVDRVDVLDKVGTLALIDGIRATTAQVAAYYGVAVKSLESVIEDHEAELRTNGYDVLRGQPLALLKRVSGMSSRAPHLAVFPRAAILNVGQLLTGSETAKAVRTYLLTVEATASREHKAAAVELMRLQERQDYKAILHFLKLGGAAPDDYRHVQNSLYVCLFGHTASTVRGSREILTWQGKRGPTQADKRVAKNYLDECELKLLNNTVLATFVQIDQHYSNGATPAQMVDAIHRAAELTLPKQIGDAA